MGKRPVGNARRTIVRKLNKRYGNLCCWCNRRLRFGWKQEEPGEKIPSNYATIEHITRIADGGTNSLSNLRLACHHCNTTRPPPPKEGTYAPTARKMKAVEAANRMSAWFGLSDATKNGRGRDVSNCLTAYGNTDSVSRSLSADLHTSCAGGNHDTGANHPTEGARFGGPFSLSEADTRSAATAPSPLDAALKEA